jgi:hypothetical protein
MTGYAYETISGKAIFAGKTDGTEDSVDDQRGTLGVLARGRK